MKRYIRLKSGQIIDLDSNCKYIERRLFANYSREDYWGVVQAHDFIKTTVIVAESDNILGLVKVGDLVRTYLDYTKLEYITEIEDKEDLQNDRLLSHINKLYTKQGDNYILVWDKERGVI